jgi:hypothetical protein
VRPSIVTVSGFTAGRNGACSATDGSSAISSPVLRVARHEREPSAPSDTRTRVPPRGATRMPCTPSPFESRVTALVAGSSDETCACVGSAEPTRKISPLAPSTL